MSLSNMMVRMFSSSVTPRDVVSGKAKTSGLWALALLGGFMSANLAQAGEPVWPQGAYPYSVVNRSLPSVLKDFGDNIGVRVTVADNVKGTVKGTPVGASAKEFLEQLSKSYSFDWYYDGSVMAFSGAQDEQSTSVPLHGLDFETARKKLQADGVLDTRFVFRPGPNPGTVVVAGPPLYVDTVTHQLATTNDAPPEADCKFVIHDGSHVTSYSGPNCAASD